MSGTKHINFHLKQERKSNTQQLLICSVLSMYSNSPSNPQVRAAHGRCAQYLSVWPLPDCTSHYVLRCFFSSYGTVQELLYFVSL